VLTAGIALLALLSWILGQWRVGALGSNYVPMAPSTGLLFLGLAGAAWLEHRRPDSVAVNRFGFTMGFGVLVMSLLIGIQILFDVQLPVAHWLSRPTETVGQIPVGRMSPLTAALFILSSLAFLLECAPKSRCRSRRQAAAMLGVVVLLCSGGVGLSYLLHEPLLYGGTVVPMAALTAAAFILIGLGLLLAAGPDTWPMSLFVPPALDARPTRRILRGLIALALLFTIAIGTTGWLYFNRQQAEACRVAQETLAAIANLKVDQIAGWMTQRRGNAEASFNKHTARKFLTEPNNAANRKELLQWMGTFQRVYNFSAVMLLDAHGAVRLAVPADAVQPAGICAEKAQAAMRAREVVSADLHRATPNSPIHMSLLVPIGINPQAGSTRSPQAGQPADGVLLLVINPQRFLYPLIQNWPTPSRTAETLLVRREGNEIVFLNKLRHRMNTALVLRLPIGDPNLPAAKAVQGQEGVVEGMDYRGIPVLAALRKVPGTPWFMVAKVDQEEIYGPLHQQAWIIAAIIGLLLLAAMLGIGLLWRQQKLEFSRHELAERKQVEEKLRQSEATIRNKLKAIIEPEGDIGTLELADIIDTPVLQAIMEEFYQLTGMLGAVLDLSGKVLVAVGWADICTKFHRVHPESCKNCLESDTCLTQGVAPGAFKAYHCKNNMWDMVTPLFVGGRHIGNVFIGQFFYKDETPDVELFREQARKYGFDEAEYLAALEKVPRFSREEVNAGMRFYSKLSEIISTLSFSAIQQSRLLAERKRAEKTLKNSETRFRALFEQAGGYCMILDPNTPDGIPVIIDANQAACDAHGYTRETFVGRPVIDIDDEDGRRLTKERTLEIMTGKPFYVENEHVRKDGTSFSVAVNAKRIDIEGEPPLIFTTEYDITERKAASDAARLSKMRYQQLFETSKDGILILDAESGVVVDVNPCLIELLGYSHEVFLGKHLWEIGLFKDIAGSKEAFLDLQDKGYIRFEDMPLETSEGERIDVEFTSNVFDVGDKKLVQCDIRDITERKRAKEALRGSEDKLRLIIDTSPVGICTVDPLGNFVMTNPAYEQMLGYSKEELRGLSFYDVTHPEDRPKNKELFQSLFSLTSSGFSMEKRYVRKDGATIDVAVNATGVMDATGHARFGTAFVRDITERRQAEAEIKQLNNELEQRVLERTAALKAANQELESFSYSVSHDLRAPLRAIDGFSLVLLEDHAQQLDPEAQEHLDRIRTATQRMGRLIDDLLGLSRMNRQPLHKAPIELGPIVQETMEQLRAEQADRRIELTLGDLPPCQGDAHLLGAVWTNLLSNALKFTSKQPVAVIEVGSEIQAGECVYFVKDNGAGFDMAYVDKLFGVFQRLHTKFDFPGTGIGLATVQRIIHRHGGRIWAEGKVDRGATFYFTLPTKESGDFSKEE